MALIKCKDCGKEVSRDAVACPQCGNDIQKQIKREKEKQRRAREKKEQQEIEERSKQVAEWIKNDELCPACGSHSTDDVCPNCGKSRKTIKWKLRAGYVSAVVIVIFILVVLVKACSSTSSNGSEYGAEEYKCAMKSSQYRTCTYSVYSQKCKCVTKK